MAENEANVNVTVDSSEIARLRGALERAEEQIRDTARSADRAERSLSAMRGGVAALGGALLSAEAVGAAFRTGIAALRAGVDAYVQSNEEAQRQVEQLSNNFTGLKESFGEALVGGDNLTNMVDVLSERMSVLTDWIDQNRESIQDAVELGFNAMMQALAVIGPMIISVAQGVLQLSAAWTEFSMSANDSVDRVDEFGNAIETDLDRINNMITALDDLKDSVGDYSYEQSLANATVDAGASSLLDFANAALEAARAQRSGSSGGRRDNGEERKLALQQDFFAAQREAQKEQQRAMMELLGEQEKARIDLIAQAAKAEEIEQSLIREKEFEAQMSHLMRMAEMEKAMRDQAGAQKLADQEKLEEAEAAKREKWKKFGQDAASSAERLAMAAFAGNAKKRKKALKKALGQELLTQGGALLALGIGHTIAGKFPDGPLEIAGGTSMIAAGAKLAGGGGKGGGGKGAKTPPTNSTPASATNNTQNVVINQNTSFGFVGDRRAATREIEEINERSVERGLAPA